MSKPRDKVSVRRGQFVGARRFKSDNHVTLWVEGQDQDGPSVALTALSRVQLDALIDRLERIRRNWTGEPGGSRGEIVGAPTPGSLVDLYVDLIAPVVRGDVLEDQNDVHYIAASTGVRTTTRVLQHVRAYALDSRAELAPGTTVYRVWLEVKRDKAVRS